MLNTTGGASDEGHVIKSDGERKFLKKKDGRNVVQGGERTHEK